MVRCKITDPRNWFLEIVSSVYSFNNPLDYSCIIDRHKSVTWDTLYGRSAVVGQKSKLLWWVLGSSCCFCHWVIHWMQAAQFVTHSLLSLPLHWAFLSPKCSRQGHLKKLIRSNEVTFVQPSRTWIRSEGEKSACSPICMHRNPCREINMAIWNHQTDVHTETRYPLSNI